MKVHIRMTGSINRPVDGLDRWFHIYWLEAANGAVAQEYDEDQRSLQKDLFQKRDRE